MANAEGRAIAAAYIAEAERLEAAGRYLWHASWCRRQAELMVGQEDESPNPTPLSRRAGQQREDT